MLSNWHPTLGDYECAKTRGRVELRAREAGEKPRKCETTLNDVRSKQMEFGEILAEVAGVSSLLTQEHKTE